MATKTVTTPTVQSQLTATDTAISADVDVDLDREDDFKLPKRSSLACVLVCNLLIQISYFIVIPTSSTYAKSLGGTNTISGAIIGVPTACAALCLAPMLRISKNGYGRPLKIGCLAMALGQFLYAIADRTGWLYLILIGRIVSGPGQVYLMFGKRFCTDPRQVGLRRRATLASWLVLTQAAGTMIGPFAGALLYRIGVSSGDSKWWNGYTAPGWLMMGLWLVFFVVVNWVFEDVQTEIVQERPESDTDGHPRRNLLFRFTLFWQDELITPIRKLQRRQQAVLACMVSYATMAFFVLGTWEAFIPSYSKDAPGLKLTPFSSGILFALGGVAAFPILVVNLFTVRKTQERHTFLSASLVGVVGLLIQLITQVTGKVHYPSFYISWVLVALGFNLLTTLTFALLSKQLPKEWNLRSSLIIQTGNYIGRVTGALWGGVNGKVGANTTIGLDLAFAGIAALSLLPLWTFMKAKTG
ncbi:hypothetical protein YB2330_003745 [Saitoella coloradoensis]